MAMWKYLKRYDEKIFENIFFEILSLPYFRKFSHSKISTYMVLKFYDCPFLIYNSVHLYICFHDWLFGYMNFFIKINILMFHSSLSVV